MKKALFVFSLLLLLLGSGKIYSNALRGLYVWNTSTQINSTTEVYRLLNQCKTDNVTDIYIWAHAYLVNPTNIGYMQAFISKAYCNNIRVWALDGDRSYLADWSGPTSYYNFITDVINYNNASSTSQKFYGIHADIEPQDGQGEPKKSFHNGLKDSGLNGTSGGLWQTTEVADREKLMESWLDIAQYSYTTSHANSLKFGMSMPSWTDNYFGEEVQCSYPTVHQGVYKYMMQYVDDYCIMSYRTTPGAVGVNNSVIDICNGELSYADGLPVASRPLIWAGLETHCGPGAAVSYCDNTTKNTRAAFWTDVATIESAFSGHISYSGMNIHDWKGGWDILSPAATNVTDPGCIIGLPVTYLSITASLVNGFAMLNWSTASEVNTKSFEIQELQSDGSYTTIGEVKASGTSNQLTPYFWMGTQIITGTSYFRIKQIDINNQFTVSSILVLNSADDKGIKVYQNIDQLVFINKQNETVDVNFTLLSIHGQLIQVRNLSLKAHEQQETSLTGLASGMYLIHYSYSGSSETNTLKIVKE